LTFGVPERAAYRPHRCAGNASLNRAFNQLWDVVMKNKITTGANDRSSSETIAQTGPGLPDDSGEPIEVSQAEVDRVRANLEKGPRTSRTEAE
jgi:hypothetical protein